MRLCGGDERKWNLWHGAHSERTARRSKADFVTIS
jgi:hypothetical protein